MHIDFSQQLLPEFAIVWLVAVALCGALIVALMPLLTRYALARPNVRSSHIKPTPQGGGIAIMAAVLLIAIPCSFALPGFDTAQLHQLWLLFATTAFLAIVGAIDDIKTVEALPRLLCQILAVGLVVVLLPEDLRVVPVLPLWIERILTILAGVWFVNLVNFMDGIDWMTAAEVIPVTVALTVLAILGALPQSGLLVAVTLAGAMIGFAPFNRPVARLFLGDVGSLPIGLLVFWLLLLLAGRGHFAAALLLPLYYLADATITLLLRLSRGESVFQAHRHHFYQQAVDRGLSVPAVVARIAAVNAVLALLALASALLQLRVFDFSAVVAGAALVALLLNNLARSER